MSPADLSRVFLEQGPACSWIIDRQYRFHSAWGNCLPLFRKPAAELRNNFLIEVLGEGAGGAWMGRIDRVFGGETLFLRERTTSPDLTHAITHFPLRSAAGEVVFAGGLAQDISLLSAAERQLRHTALRILKTQDADRGRLARFLHDDVGQCLSSAGLQLDLLRMDLEQHVPAISSRTAEIQQVLEGVMARVREYSFELNPDIVERAGLSTALDRLAGRSRREFPGTFRLMADTSFRLPPQVGSAIYRIAQEAVENAIQHSSCSLIELILKSTKSGPTLEVRDNGKGFDSSDVSGLHRGLGLLVMEHYAAQAQLQLAISSERGKGTVVRAVYVGRD